MPNPNEHECKRCHDTGHPPGSDRLCSCVGGDPEPSFLPTRSEVERAWVARQAELDIEAGREPNPFQYSAEFRRWLKSEVER